MTRRLVRLAVCTLLIIAVVQAAAGAGAQPTRVAGPGISLDRTSVQSGERITVTFTDWHARLLTVSVCGNLARRGSADCNMVASQGVSLAGAGQKLTEALFVVTAPASTCPCVIRAASIETAEVAVAPIELVGHPVGPVVDPFNDEALDVSVKARAAPKGILATLRSALGGPTTYAVTVSVQNRTATVLENVAVTGSAGRTRSDEVTVFELAAGPLEPGQAWLKEFRTALPAPAVGRYVWQVTASGAGPVAHAEDLTRRLPVLLVVLVLILVADLATIAARFIGRRRRGHVASELNPG